MTTPEERWKDDEWEGLDDAQRAWMRRAFELAEEALREAEVPVGCVLVLDGREVGAGRNAVNELKDPTRHAEMCALERLETECAHLRQNLDRLELYVSLEPCIMCASALYQLGIKKIVYGAANERFGGIVSVGDASKYGMDSKIEKTRSVELLKTFYDKQNPFAPEEKRKLKKNNKMEKEE